MLKVIHPEEECVVCEAHKIRVRELTNAIVILLLICVVESIFIAFLMGSIFF